MPKVIIVEPNNTPEQEKEALKNIAYVIEKSIFEEYGAKVKVTIHDKRGNKMRDMDATITKLSNIQYAIENALDVDNVFEEIIEEIERDKQLTLEK